MKIQKKTCNYKKKVQFIPASDIVNKYIYGHAIDCLLILFMLFLKVVVFTVQAVNYHIINFSQILYI